MDADIVDEDSIDTEALQAQIDLSMSFAQSLVSSWMEPRKLPTSARKRDLEKELSEYMKRPPRLGVGASIPEGHQNLSREAARLKGKLTGSNKRLGEGEAETASAPARRTEDDDDEDESRAGAIKKKQKLDPFNITHGKKKKKHHAKNDLSEHGTPTLSVRQPSSQNGHDDVKKPYSLLDGTQSPSQKQEWSNQETLARNEDFAPPQDSAVEEASLTLTRNVPSPKQQAIVTSLSLSRHLPESDRKTEPEPEPTSPTTTLLTTIAPRNPTHAELLKRPLLNLTGPPVNSDDDESDTADARGTESPLTSPKKKRKRRKKKKHHPITELGCHTTTAAAAAPSTILLGIQT